MKGPDALIGLEVKPLFSLLAAKAAIVNQLHGLSVLFCLVYYGDPKEAISNLLN
jgi:hypothetical protein